MFTQIKASVAAALAEMQETSRLFVVDNEGLWDTYLASFPEGSNPLFRERTAHDCSCCKHFIRTAGAIVSVDPIDSTLKSIWDIDVGGDYQVVADTLAAEVKSRPIINAFLHDSAHLGTDFNHEMLPDGTVKQWDHFYHRLPGQFVVKSDRATRLGDIKSSVQVFKRSMEELTLDSGQVVLELIQQNSLYRGEEHREAVKSFIDFRQQYNTIRAKLKDNFCWLTALNIGGLARFRNTAIGTLLTDLSDGVDLERAVTSFEAKVAPTNYKRTSALVTQSMIKRAQKKAEELGIVPALERRHAKMTDITVNNVLFASRPARVQMGVFEELAGEVEWGKKQNFDKVDEVPIDKFISDVLPVADTVEVLVENKHRANLMSLLAPVDSYAKSILKWSNNFSWAYAGDVTDSIKENVKRHGGNVTGVLRFSIQWNDDPKTLNPNDYDAHCHEPDGNLISYPVAGNVQSSSGVLDVDIIHPKGVAVENITWSNVRKMHEGEYEFLVHCYSHRGGRDGFRAEIEYNGIRHEFEYRRNLEAHKKVQVARLNFFRATGFSLQESLESTSASLGVWGVQTNTFVPVSAIMHSPNHWDDNRAGNKHLFFILQGCRNEEPVRGFFNEFLRADLIEHRKVFEVLGNKMKIQPADSQLSGVGFSTTQRNQVVVRVAGKFTRTLKVLF